MNNNEKKPHVEFIKTRPSTTTGQSFEKFPHLLVIQTITAIEHHALLRQCFGQIFGRFGFTSPGGTGWCSPGESKIEKSVSIGRIGDARQTYKYTIDTKKARGNTTSEVITRSTNMSNEFSIISRTPKSFPTPPSRSNNTCRSKA